jgi:hypothetical protein
VASFVGFLQFYSKFIPNFEIRVEPLRCIMEHDYTKALGEMWTPEAQITFDDLRGSILCNPCLRWFDPRKLTILRTDFLSKGFGYVVCLKTHRLAAAGVSPPFKGSKNSCSA